MKQVFWPILSLFLLSACEDSLQKNWAAFTREPQWLKAERAANPGIRKPTRARLTADVNATESATTSPKRPSKSKTVKREKEPAVTEYAQKTSTAPLQYASADGLLPLPSSDKGSEPRTVILDEYDAATGERCRHYAYYESPTEPGEMRTACRVGKQGRWIDLRPLTHKTLSPLVISPSIGTAMTQDQP